MYLYRNKPKITASHTFHDDTNPVLTVSDACLEVTDKATGETVAAGNLINEPTGRVLAIFDRASLPLGTYEFLWLSQSANAYDIETVEVVGFPYFSLFELRSSDAAELVADESIFADVRDLVEQRIESLVDRAFRPTYQKETLMLGAYAVEPTRSDVREVLSADFKGTKVLTQVNAGHIEVVDESVIMHRGELLTVEYVYGADMNADIKRACLLLAEAVLQNTQSNVTSRTLDGGIFERFVVGGVGNAATSVPEVNEIIERYKRRF